MRRRSRVGALALFIGLLTVAAIGLACTSDGSDSSSSARPSSSNTAAGSTSSVSPTSTTSSASSTSTASTAVSPAATLINRAVELAQTLPMQAALETGREQPWTFFFAKDGWLLQSEDPQRSAPRTVMGRSGDLYFWTIAFEGEERIVTATLAELGTLYHDKKLPSNRVLSDSFVRAWSGFVLMFNPLETLSHAQATGPLERLSAGGQRARAEVEPWALLKSFLEEFDITDPTDPSSLAKVGLWPEVLTSPIDLVLEVDKDGAPTKLVATYRGTVEGSPAQPRVFNWRRLPAPPSFPLADALDFATVVAEPWPTGWMPAYRLRPPQPTRESVEAYLEQQRGYLALALEKMKWPEMRGLVTFRRPLADDTARSIASGPNLRVEYLEWETTNGKHGNTSTFVAKNTEKIREVFYPDKPTGYVRLVAVGMIGRFTDYEPISKNPDVLLVDLGPVPEMIDPLLEGKSLIGEPTRGLYQMWVQAGRP